MTHIPYTASIHHDGSSRYVHIVGGGEPRLGGEAVLRMRASLEAPIEKILLRTAPDGEQRFTELALENETGVCRWWQVRLPLSMPVVSYRFLLITGDGVWWYNGSGLHRHNPTDAEDFRILTGYSAPAWVRESVFYQIFPDRFADGDPGNNVRDGEFEYWGIPSRARGWGEPLSTGRASMVEFFGGDLAGVEARLDYLADLGVNAIYLNPVFTALSNHRYDVMDYENVDPHLGGNTALASLRRATQERGMRFILDIVPNHCGFFHPWFQAALADSGAPTAEFFTFHRHPDEYESWLGVKSLPKLNYSSQKLRQVMYAGPEAVFRKWLRPPFSVDGWRLDVANMLGQQGANQLGIEVGRAIRQALRQENEAAYILGENFFDASPQLQGDMWDASMNYSGFSKPLKYWLEGFQVRQHAQPNRVGSPVPWPTQAMADTWGVFRAAIPWVVARQQFNLLGSHDTERIYSVVKGSPGLNRLAAGILLTYLGAPSIYYGDEVGMGAGKYVESRACMPWDPQEWDTGLRAFYQALIHLRRTSPALIGGGLQVLLVEDNTVAYLRDAEEEQIVVVAHRGPGPRPGSPLPVAHAAIPNGTEMVDVISGKRAVVAGGSLPLQALPAGIEIWKTSR